MRRSCMCVYRREVLWEVHLAKDVGAKPRLDFHRPYIVWSSDMDFKANDWIRIC